MNQFTNESIFKELEGKTLSYLLKKCCDENDLDKIKYLFESDVLKEIFGIGKSKYLSDTLEELERIILDSELIKKCCEVKSIEILKYFLSYCNGMNQFTKEELQSQLNDCSIIACQVGSVEVLDYILNSNEIELHAKIDSDLMFYQTCSNNHIEIFEYLFKLPQMKNDIDFTIKSGELLQLACAYANLNTIKYILTYPDFENKINIHVENEKAFRILINQEKNDVIQYLIFDFKIEKNDDLAYLLQEKKRLDIVKMFETRDLKGQLSNELKESHNLVKKIKI